MKLKTEVVVIGGGLTGITMACSLAGSGVSVIVIESSDPKKIKDAKSDGRTSAIANGSSKIFADIGVWEDMAKHAGEILDIRVTDNDCPVFLHYDHALLGKDPLGYMVENHVMLKALYKKAESLKDLNILAPARYESVERNSNNVIVRMAGGQIIEASLLIAADGKNSQIRDNAGIQTIHHDYNQVGIVCTIEHESNHNGIAQERFLSTGPFAVLPMQGGYHSSLVWTEKTDIAPLYMAMDDDEFLEFIDIKSGGYLGKIELASDRFAYPLKLALAKKYTDTRLALIGDAAHGMHPLAGQGFNVGIRDVAELTKQIMEAKRSGFDIGGAIPLANYEALRKFDSISLVAITDGLNKIFDIQLAPVKIARRLGMGFVNKMPPLKKFFMRHAMGSASV